MALLGGIIKKAIDLKELITKDPEPAKEQQKVLLHLLETARHTAFGMAYGFDDILKSEDFIKAFQQRVPVFDYDGLYENWWHYLLKGHQNITWPGGQQYFALSSGTTSNQKAIPVTDDMLQSIRQSGIQQIFSLTNFELTNDYFEKDILMLGSSTNLVQKQDHKEGEISGISAANIPAWFNSFYKPGAEIASIADWDEKVKRIAEEAPGWDVGSISGIPSWVELMLKEIIAHNKLQNIHDIWPNLQVFTSGGVAFEPYRASIEKLLARPLIYIETYLASEGYIATQKRPDTNAMALITDNGMFFEFVPFKDENIDEEGRVKKEAPVFTLEETVEGDDYILLLSTVSGAWRYMIGDTVTITNKEKSEIRISGRTKHYLNVVGEQLSVQKMNMAIQKLGADFDTEVKEFTACTYFENEEYKLKWIIGIDKEIDTDKAAMVIDEELCNNNKNYKVARGKSLKGVTVEAVPTEKFYNWSETFKNMGGQAKIPRVMKEDAFDDLRNFLHG